MSEPLRFELCLPVTIKGLDTCKTVELEARFTVLASSAEEAKVQLQEALSEKSAQLERRLAERRMLFDALSTSTL